MKKLLILLACGLVCWNLYLTAELAQLRTRTDSDEQEPNTEQLTQPVSVVTSDITRIAEASQSRVAGIQALDEDGELIASGTGTIYSVSGQVVTVITNLHLVEQSSRILVRFASGEQLEAQWVGADEATDLVVLTINPDFLVEPFELGDSSLCTNGEWVIAMGYSDKALNECSTAVGVITSHDRIIPFDPDEDQQQEWEMIALQTDAAINEENTGGPLLNLNGELIGITTTQLDDQTAQDNHGAIPINEVSLIVEQLKSTGMVSRPDIGMNGRDISSLTSYQKSYLGISLDLTEGVLISRLRQEGPAQRAGVQLNDVLVRFDGTQIDSTKTFRKLLYAKAAGEQAELVVLRQGQEIQLSVTLE